MGANVNRSTRPARLNSRSSRSNNVVVQMSCCRACGSITCPSRDKTCRHYPESRALQRSVISSILRDLAIQRKVLQADHLIEKIFPPNEPKVVQWSLLRGNLEVFRMWLDSDDYYGFTSGWEPFSYSDIYTDIMAIGERPDFKKFIWDRIQGKDAEMPTV